MGRRKADARHRQKGVASGPLCLRAIGYIAGGGTVIDVSYDPYSEGRASDRKNQQCGN